MLMTNDLEQCAFSDARSVHSDKTRDRDSDDHQGKTSVDSVFNEYLIQVVQRSPLIYDYRHENYNNSTAKQEVWDSIAESLCSTVDAVKVRWKTLRDRYQRERKRLAAEEANGRIVFSPFAHFNKMEFLNNFLGEGTKVRNNKRPKRTSPTFDDGNSDETVYDIEEKRPKETSVNEDLLSIIQNKIERCEAGPEYNIKLEEPADSGAVTLDAAFQQEPCTSSYGLPTNLAMNIPVDSITTPISTTSLLSHSVEASSLLSHGMEASSLLSHGVEASSLLSHSVEASSLLSHGVETSSLLSHGVEASSLLSHGVEASSLLAHGMEPSSLGVETPSSDVKPRRYGEVRKTVKPKTLLRRKKMLEKRLAAAHQRIRPAVAACAAEVATFGIPNYGPITEDVLFAQSIGAKLAKIPDGPDKDRLKMTIWMSFINFSTSHQSELLPMELDAASNFR